ncbi:MAG: ribosome biogenesis GTPase Der [bacterium]|nr:ribosome biogenesis GTPase Der [bacterium]
MRLPLVAIVGAPNVGKSTLFNRLVGKRQAIVTDEPGVTRDRQYAEVRDAPRPFRLVDTGGLTPNTAAPMADEIEMQARAALDEASVILFVLDSRAGATALDHEVATFLRRQGLPLVLVANKIDSQQNEALIHELHELGVGEPFPTSAEHGFGVGDLLDRIAELLGESTPHDDEIAEESEAGEERPLQIAIVGRPNVGKSSLLNRLVGEERMVVSDVPGTTRDAVDTLLELDGRRYRLIDTAGIRRRGRVERGVERFSVVRAQRNIEACDVAVLVIDASDEFAAQDAHIAGEVVNAFKPMVVAVNKWDLIEGREEQAKRWEETVRDRLKFARAVPMVLISAKTGQRVTRVLERAEEAFAEAGVHVATAELNRWLREVASAQMNASPRRDALRIYYATQTGIHPPTIRLFCNEPKRVHFSYRRRLQNTLRDRYGFGSAPIKLQFRRRREERER